MTFMAEIHSHRDINPDTSSGLWPVARQSDVDDAAVYAVSTASVERELSVIERTAHQRLEDALVEHARAARVEVDRFDGRVIVRVTHSGVTGTAEWADRL